MTRTRVRQARLEFPVKSCRHSSGVEQLSCKQQVLGSNPGAGSTISAFQFLETTEVDLEIELRVSVTMAIVRDS